MVNIQQAGVVYNRHLDIATQMAQDICTWLSQRDVRAWSCPASELQQKCDKPDVILTLGGDGTILRVAQQAAPMGVPLLGINLGRVGFLTEAQPDAWRQTLNRVLGGEAMLESRTMLDVALIRDGEVIEQEHALNDAVVSRSALARTVRLRTYIDGALLTRYVTDSLILATATGSTAYAYAVGGPILPPWLDNILLIPAAPHLSLERPMVLDPQATVEVHVSTRIPGMLSVDGRMEGELHNDDVVRIQRSALQTQFLRLRSRSDYYRTLVSRLIPRNGD